MENYEAEEKNYGISIFLKTLLHIILQVHHASSRLKKERKKLTHTMKPTIRAANETKTQKHERNVNEGFQKSLTWNESNVVQNDQNRHLFERRMKIISLFVAIRYSLATYSDTRYV